MVSLKKKSSLGPIIDDSMKAEDTFAADTARGREGSRCVAAKNSDRWKEQTQVQRVARVWRSLVGVSTD
jgi:hypothetical protein